MTSPQRSGALFVLGATTAGQRGPVASWLSTAGWAAAAERVLGRAWIVTPDGPVDPAGARSRASGPELASSGGGGVRSRIPATLKTAVKDVRTWRRARAMRVPAGPWDDTELAFVWQRHGLFETAGIAHARSLGVPSVLFVPATVIWEAEQWGVHRPGWGSALERIGESPALRAADLIAVGSDLVAAEVERLGADPSRIVVTPTGVDLEPFLTTEPDPALRTRLGLGDRFVVGWTGSFRKFHGVERAVDALVGLPDTVLLLVGDGPERPRVEAHARASGVDVVHTGTVAHEDLPPLLMAMDVAVVLDPPTGAFHYSPLKLAEYLAAGRTVIAPDVPHLAGRLRDGVDVVLVPPHDAHALAATLAALRTDPDRRRRIGSAAREAAATGWSWDDQVERVLAALPEPAPSGLHTAAP